MKKSIFLIIALCAISAISANAQVKYSLIAGYSQVFNISNMPPATHPQYGAHAGLLFSFSINKQPQLKLSTGIVYRYAGYHQNDNSIFPDHTTYPGYTYSEYISSHAVFIPLRINLDFPLNTLWTISLLTGPQLSFKWENLIHQNVQTTPTTKTTFEGGLFSPYDIIPADCTWGAGLIVKYKRLFLQTVFDIGLFNRNTEAFVNLINHINPIYSRELTVSIGYEF